MHAPEWLPAAQRQIWADTLARVAPARLSEIDPDILAAYVAAVDQHRSALALQAACENAGAPPFLAQDDQGGRMTIAPYVSMMERAASRILKLAPRIFGPRAVSSRAMQDAEDSPVAEGVAVNKAEMAHILRVSLPTLTRWLLKYGPEFPVLERGTNGKDYAFDAAEVLEFLRTKQEEQSSSREERDQQLEQLRLDLELPEMAPAPRGVSPKEELEIWRLRRLQREEAVAAGALVSASTVRDRVGATLARLSRDAHAFLRQLGQEQHWPDSYTRAVLGRFADHQRATVRDLETTLAGTPQDQADARLAG